MGVFCCGVCRKTSRARRILPLLLLLEHDAKHDAKYTAVSRTPTCFVVGYYNRCHVPFPFFFNRLSRDMYRLARQRFNRQVFIRFLSPSSAMHGVEMEGVARYLAENRNRAFMHWDAIAYPRSVLGRARQIFASGLLVSKYVY